MPRSPLVTAGTGAAILGAGVLAFAISTSAPGDPPGVRTSAAAPASITPPASPSASPTSRSTSPSETRSPSPSPSAPTSTPPSDSDSVAWIEVGGVGIRTAVDPRGLSADGTISPPKGTVMWFTGYDRVMPGLVGTSVVAGHVAVDGSPDVFAPLPGVRPGTKVRVGYHDGDVLDLTVVRTEVLAKDELQTDPDVWGANSTTRRVVLITCDDAYGFRSDGHRVANFVAVAEPV
jgi:hypothetical protein